MNWIPAFREPWAWGLLASIPVGIILLYFLKLRRVPVEVPSTYLWAKTMEDLHVNSLLQRLRRSLLLLLQLLVVLLAAIALLRPGVRDQAEGRERLVFLLDASASMGARDVAGGGTRFDQARRRIGERIDAMTDREQAMLIGFSDRAEVWQSFTSDRRRLREALGRATVSNRGTDLVETLRLADGLAMSFGSGSENEGEPGVGTGESATAAADLLLFSDGGFSPVSGLNLANLAPRYHAVGSEVVTNLAITAFAADRNLTRPEELEAIATVANLGTTSASATAVLTSEGTLLDATEIDLDPGEQTGIAFTIERDGIIGLELTLEIEDDLALDNRAFTGLTPPRTVSVLVVTPGNPPLELGLGTERAAEICRSEFVPLSYLQTEAYRNRAAAGVDDLILFDRCSPPEMPRTNTFSIGALPDSGWSWVSDPGPPLVVDFDRTHPLLRYIELYSLLIFQGQAVSGPAGTKTLVGGDTGPLLCLAERDGFQDLVLGFEILTSDSSGATQTNTNWYAERSWPVFLLNVLRSLAGATETTVATSYRPGETVRLRPESIVDEVVVRRVGGPTWSLARGPGGGIDFIDTDQPGQYLVESEGRLIDTFSINLFDRQESRLAVVPEVELGDAAVVAVTTGERQRREFWRWMLLAVLGLLVTEWWIYSRRLG